MKTEPNKLSLKQCAEKYLKQNDVSFIIAGNFAVHFLLKEMEPYDNDKERMEAVTEMLENLIKDKPNFIKLKTKK